MGDGAQSTTLAAVPLVDLTAQYEAIRPEIDAAIARVLSGAEFIMGPDVAAFEAEFAAFCGAEHCVGVGSGTAALELALRALEIGPGDEVITSAHTFIATAEAISAVGATPVFADIDPVIYTLAADAVAERVTPRTRAVIPVHLYGQPAEMDAIMGVAQRFGLAVIEDAAQAHAATWNGRTVGTLADVACFSFYPGKNLGAYGDAGAITTGSAKIAERVRLLRNHGRRDKYVHDVIGFGHRLDTLQAAILRVKLRHLPAWTAARRRLAAIYCQLLAGSDVVLPTPAAQAEPAWHLFVVLVQERDRVLAALKQAGIGAGVHYPVPLHLQPAYAGLGYRQGDLPVTERVAATCLSLPLFAEMSDAQQRRVVEALRAAIGEMRPVVAGG